MKKMLNKYVMRKSQIQTSMRNHYTPAGMAKNQKHRRHQMLERMWGTRHSPPLLVGMQHGAATLEDASSFLQS